MKDIKTREYVKSVKVLDRDANLSDKMKQAIIRTADKTKQLSDSDQENANQYAEEQVQSSFEEIAYDGSQIVIDNTKKTAEYGKKAIREIREQKRIEQAKAQSQQQTDSIQHSPSPTNYEKGPQAKPANQTIKTKEVSQQAVKESAKSAGNASVKTVTSSVKTSQQTIKTAEQSSRVAIKTAQTTAKTAEQTAQATAKAAAKTKQVIEAAAKATAEAVKAAAKATVEAVKAIVAAIKELVAAIAAGGWVAVLIIVVIVLVALVAGSIFGIFFSSEDTGSELTMRQVVQQVNDEYQAQLDNIRYATSYDTLETSGSRAVWPEVLSIYAVMVYTDPTNPQEVATVDASKQALLEEIFWAMNSISYNTEVHEEIVVEEIPDDEGNIEVVESTVYVTTLYITVSHKTAEEMAVQYGFTAEQLDMLHQLLDDGNDSMWGAVLYGIHTADEQIVAVAEAQIGNIGGQPYWSWYGYDSRVAWCAIFVSWCANECGYIDDGIIPKFAWCDYGVYWFKERHQWVDGNETPVPGMIIFFDWDSPNGESGPQDGSSDHVGIVEKVENGIVYTIEGNRSDSCKRCTYSVGHYQILGYGVPAY